MWRYKETLQSSYDELMYLVLEWHLQFSAIFPFCIMLVASGVAR